MSAHTPTHSGAMAQATLPETKHTPGPWRDIGDGYVEAGSAPLKFRSGWYDSAYLTSEAREEWQANAALIARAPDLLAENERLREDNTRLTLRLAEACEEDERFREALDVPGIRKLEDDVRYYSGNEASGYAEITRRKAAAWDRMAALSEQEGK